MATNDFLPIATGGGANVLTQAQYAALTSILANGFQTGTINSSQVNKVWRQASIMSAVLAQFIADGTGANSVDDGTTATLLANLKNAVQGYGVVQYADATGTDTITASYPNFVTSALADGDPLLLGTAGPNTTTAPTFAPTLGGVLQTSRPIKKWVGGTLISPAVGDIQGVADLVYDSVNLSWILQNPSQLQSTPIIPTITSTVAANALTIGVSAQSLSFRSATAGSGAITTITATPSNLVVPAGATLGTIAATAARLVILELLNAGVAELAIVNLAGGNQLDETNLISTTAISAGATAANVIYSTTARTGIPYRVVGFIDITEATAGTWATAPTTVQGVGGQALAAMSSMGYGQTWQSFTVGSGNQRIFSTTYYNTTGKPIMVTIWQYSYLNANLTYTVNGFTVQWSGAGSVTGISDSVSFIVPPNGSYSANSATGWLELR